MLAGFYRPQQVLAVAHVPGSQMETWPTGRFVEQFTRKVSEAQLRARCGCTLAQGHPHGVPRHARATSPTPPARLALPLRLPSGLDAAAVAQLAARHKGRPARTVASIGSRLGHVRGNVEGEVRRLRP